MLWVSELLLYYSKGFGACGFELLEDMCKQHILTKTNKIGNNLRDKLQIRLREDVLDGISRGALAGSSIGVLAESSIGENLAVAHYIMTSR